MLRPTTLAVACALLAASPVALSSQQRAATPAPAELIVSNARIYTVDPSRPIVEALAVRGGRIVFAGSEREAAAFRGGATRSVDLGGRTVIPGMVDAHAHLVGLGEALANVDLVDTRSYDDVIARVVARARQVPAGTWIQGRGWDQNDWGNTAFPTHEALSRAVPDHPVMSRIWTERRTVGTLVLGLSSSSHTGTFKVSPGASLVASWRGVSLRGVSFIRRVLPRGGGPRGRREPGRTLSGGAARFLL